MVDLALIVDPDVRERVESARERLTRERLRILVIGEFSRGKSTFVNALIGQPVLPSKVNPTTATINVLRGGSPAQCEVAYLDGSSEILALPQTRINRFLDGVVTVANEKAHQIRTVTIQVPGRLERIQADIIDTPGVNDLDQAREEVTFSYLREADAAIMVLDASQPISESERSFLTDKVLGADVNRIVFVINKADEILYDGDVDDIERIRQYVIGRVREHLGLRDPEVHAVAAKTALRARFKGEPDPFPLPFEEFEKRLVAFATTQALSQPDRLKVHLDRVDGLLELQRSRVVDSLATLQADVGDLEASVARAEQSREALDVRLSMLDARLSDASGRLAERIARHTRHQVVGMRADLEARLRQCQTDDDIEDFRQNLSSELRSLVEGIDAHGAQERERFVEEVTADFGELVEGSATGRRREVALRNYRDIAPAVRGVVRASEEGTLEVEQMAVGIGLGFVGAALFGPIGFAAGVMGTYAINRSKRAQRAETLAQAERDHLVRALQAACARLAERAESFGHEVAEREARETAEGLRAAARIREQRGRSALVEARRAATASLEEREERRRELTARQDVLDKLAARALTLRMEVCP